MMSMPEKSKRPEVGALKEEQLGGLAVRAAFEGLDKSAEDYLKAARAILKEEFKLTNGEITVFEYLGNDLPNTELSRKSRIKFNTVRAHLTRTYTKLGGLSRPEAVSLSRDIFQAGQEETGPPQPSGRSARLRSHKFRGSRIA